jgi:hypothetical protein
LEHVLKEGELAVIFEVIMAMIVKIAVFWNVNR